MSLLELFCDVDDFNQHFQTTLSPNLMAGLVAYSHQPKKPSSGLAGVVRGCVGDGSDL